jgi:hypothetical protein
VRPNEGSYFALLFSGYQQSAAAKISRPFEVSNGDTVSGWAFLQNDGVLRCTELDDGMGQVVIKSESGTTVVTPFEQNTSTMPCPHQFTRGYSGWMYWEHTFSGLTGTELFRIEARVRNNDGYWGRSRVGLDDVKTSTGGDPDTTPPETYITSGPCGPTPSTSATFEFHSNEQGSTFKCQLSRSGTVERPWAECTSPKSYSNLGSDYWKSSYRFEVKATDPAGNVDPTPASRQWYIEEGTEPQPTPPPTDTTAPKVDSVLPEEDATGAARTTNVTATFSEKMMDTSINGTTFKLFKKGSTTKIDAQVSYPDPNSPPYTAKLDRKGKSQKFAWPRSNTYWCPWMRSAALSGIPGCSGPGECDIP